MVVYESLLGYEMNGLGSLKT